MRGRGARLCLFFAAFSVISCAQHDSRLKRQPLITTERGLSDLAPDGKRGYFAISERGGTLVPIACGQEGRFTAGAPIPIAGLPEGSDTESVAWLGADRIAIGTERQEPEREYDDILLATLDGTRGSVTGVVHVHWTDWEGLRAAKNRGLEALSAVGQTLFFIGETSSDKPGLRRAPLGRIDAGGDTIARTWLRLTTETGRISALACRPGSKGVEAFAIERHYGVARILHFTIPDGALPLEILPDLYLDMAPLLKPIPNIEGIAFGPASGKGTALYLITDNDNGGGISGPTEMITVAN